MKKIIVLILVFLPIFLMISISFAGRIFSIISFIEVESVSITTEDGEEITDMLKIGLNSPVIIKAKVLPELATDKRVTFRSLSEKTCSITNYGELIGLDWGSTTIIVETENMKKTYQIDVQVTDELVSSVSLSVNELELNVKERYGLTASVFPDTASVSVRKVTWHSSDRELLEVNSQGMLYAKAKTEEPVIITVSVETEDGTFTDSCLVIIKNEKPMITFIPPDDGSSTYKLQVSSINLMNFIDYNEQYVNASDIKFVVFTGVNFATISANVLNITSTLKPITIRAYIVGQEQYYSEMIFVRMI